VAAGKAEGSRVEQQLGTWLVGPLPAPVTAASGALFVGILALCGTLWGHRARPARSCSRCGRPVCAACDPETAGGSLCGQCLTVFARRAPADPGAREQKERSVRAHLARRSLWTWAGGLALAGPFLSGRAVSGGLVLVAGWFCVLLAAVPDGVVLPMYGGWPQHWKLLAVAPALAALVVGSWRAARGGR